MNHTGQLSARQAHWAAVLAIPNSVLAHDCALAAIQNKLGHDHGPRNPVLLGVEANRHPRLPTGVKLRYVSGLADRALHNTSPPRMKPEHAALRVASRASDDVEAVARLSDVLGSKLTTAGRIAFALTSLPSLPRRAWLASVVADLANGTCSVLEHGYFDRVERPHGLPASTRQSARQTTVGAEYRDVEYEEFGVIVELDGRAFHESARARERDYERDLDDRVAAKEVVRLAWGQVFRHDCRTAGKVGAVLRRRGWQGAPTPCGPSCALAR